MTSILLYVREHNFNKWFVYWIPKTRVLGVKDSKNVVYEKVCTLQERQELLKCSKTLVEEQWNDLFNQSGLHIDEIAEKELVLTFALQRNITLERTEVSGSFDECLYLEYLRLKTLVNSAPSHLKRKRTASAAEPTFELKTENPTAESTENEHHKKLVPLRKRTAKIVAKPTGPKFEYD